MNKIVSYRKVTLKSGGNPEITGKVGITGQYGKPREVEDIDTYLQTLGYSFLQSEPSVSLYVYDKWTSDKRFDSFGCNYIMRLDKDDETWLVLCQIHNIPNLSLLKGDI